MGKDEKILLSIIIPFFNSESKCSRILEKISNCEEDDIEFILIDDGSTDATLSLLKDVQKYSRCLVRIIEQENRGPGGARNSGLDCSAGEYIWLVDSDDDILLDSAVKELRRLSDYGYDFIDFKIKDSRGVHQSMDLEIGQFSTEDEFVQKSLLHNFGRIWSKIFKKQVFDSVHLRYPEFCIFEDNPVGFVLPFLVDRFYVSEQLVYLHDETHPSVTRGERSYRYYDRMFTSILGYKAGSALCRSREDHVRILEERFFRLYFLNTYSIAHGGPKAWFERVRVIKQFRDDAKYLGVGFAPMLQTHRGSLSFKGRLLFEIQWFGSFLIPSQKGWFETKRIEAWGRSFSYEPFLDIKS